MVVGERLAADIIRMEGAKTWSELDAICRETDEFYDWRPAGDDIRRAYENIKTRHAKRVAATLAA